MHVEYEILGFTIDQEDLSVKGLIFLSKRVISSLDFYNISVLTNIRGKNIL